MIYIRSSCKQLFKEERKQLKVCFLFLSPASKQMQNSYLDLYSTRRWCFYHSRPQGPPESTNRKVPRSGFNHQKAGKTSVFVQVDNQSMRHIGALPHLAALVVHVLQPLEEDRQRWATPGPGVISPLFFYHPSSAACLSLRQIPSAFTLNASRTLFASLI